MSYFVNEKEQQDFEKFRHELIQKIEQRRNELGLTQEDIEETPWAINVRTYQRIEILKRIYR